MIFCCWSQCFEVGVLSGFIIIITRTIFMVLSSWQSIVTVTRFIWWMQTQLRGGRQPSDQANRLGMLVCQKEMTASVHIHHCHFIITQPESWYSFYRPTEGGRLSRPRHCSKFVQPVPKTVCRSGCHDKQFSAVRFGVLSHCGQVCYH